MSGILPSSGDTGINKTNRWLMELTFYCGRQLTSKYKIQLQTMISATRKNKTGKENQGWGEKGGILNSVRQVSLGRWHLGRALTEGRKGATWRAEEGQSRQRAQWAQKPWGIHAWTARQGLEGERREVTGGESEGQPEARSRRAPWPHKGCLHSECNGKPLGRFTVEQGHLQIVEKKRDQRQGQK